MKLAAQRVIQTTGSSRQGFNAFCYLHPGVVWLDKPPKDLGPGLLANQYLEVQPPMGNRVRSYLDIVAPDSTPSRQISTVVQDGAVLMVDMKKPLPWHVAHGEITFTFGLDPSLAKVWSAELRTLLAYALRVRVAPGR